MKIYVVGSSKNKFLQLDNIREKFLIDQPHEGDNIDFLNPWYCELTGLYYLWKHVDDEIVGLEHYRRYFVNEKDNLLSESEIKEILKTHDIICINRDKQIKDKLLDRFKILKNDKDLIRILCALKYKYPNSYEQIKEFLNKKEHYQFNMFICKKELINNYCQWLFDIIDIALEVYQIASFNKRSIGYISEILLFSFWLTTNNKKIYENKMVWIK